MARVLALSSHVAYGSVGLAAIVPALQQLGHQVLALPTIVLSNHPGYACFSGEQIAPTNIDQMVDALEANGWLADVEAVFTGYLPTPVHVSSAKSAVERIRRLNASALFVCDPVLGDDPGGLYIDVSTAVALREHLLPLCDTTTPNRFELSWLSEVTTEGVQDAARAAAALGIATVLATSIPASDNRLATLLVSQNDTRACFVPRRHAAPHGTGDLFAALYLGHVLNGLAPEAGLGRAVAGVEASIAASSGRNELLLTVAERSWARIEPLPAETI